MREAIEGADNSALMAEIEKKIKALSALSGSGISKIVTVNGTIDAASITGLGSLATANTVAGYQIDPNSVTDAHITEGGLSDAVVDITNIDALGLKNADKLIANRDDIALGFNSSFSAWTLTHPDNWSAFSTSPAPTKEETIVRTGKYAARFVSPGGADRGMVCSRVFTSTPLKNNTFLAGTADFYTVSKTAGAFGLLIRLYTNAALSTYADQFVVAAAVLGQWERVTWSARAPMGQNIYGIAVFVMASWGSFPGGFFVGDAIFGGFSFALFNESVIGSGVVTTLKIQTGAVTSHILSENNTTRPIGIVATTGASLPAYNRSNATFVHQISAVVISSSDEVLDLQITLRANITHWFLKTGLMYRNSAGSLIFLPSVPDALYVEIVLFPNYPAAQTPVILYQELWHQGIELPGLDHGITPPGAVLATDLFITPKSDGSLMIPVIVDFSSGLPVGVHPINVYVMPVDMHQQYDGIAHYQNGSPPTYNDTLYFPPMSLTVTRSTAKATVYKR